MKPRSFDTIAPYYDTLARIIFGKSLAEAQVFFVDRLKPDSSILIVGGGTGWIIREVHARTENCSVWFVEKSQEMLRRARHFEGHGRTRFIHGTEADLPAMQFDAVITNFYLDLYPPKTMVHNLYSIGRVLKPQGLWLVTDFVTCKPWHGVMLWVMYRFFRLVCGIEAGVLPDWEQALSDMGYEPVASRSFFGSFIKAVVLNTPVEKREPVKRL